MGTVIGRKRKDGTVGYHAQIAIRKDGVSHRETRTFDRRPAAHAWIEKRERELGQPGALAEAKRDDPTLAAVIDRYTAESRRAIGRTKTGVLRAIRDTDLGARRVSTISSVDVVALARDLAATRTPQTVANYLSHLAAVFRVARPAWGVPLDNAAMRDAIVVTGRLGLTGKTRARERRPTLEELDRLMTHFGARQVRRPTAAPMQRIVAFAIFSTRRLEEITLLRRADLDVATGRVLVRDMKNPGDKAGNDTWCDLPAEALAIALAMPDGSDRLFPFTTDAIGAAFTRGCATLGIEDLHFHDLRHDGVSRLFELGWNIPHVAAVSGHRNWTSLKRYTHLRQSGDKYAGWAWLPVVTSEPEPLDSDADEPEHNENEAGREGGANGRDRS